MSDPFACFGGDSDSDSSSADEGNTTNNNSKNEDDKNIDRARQLMDTYNNNTNTMKNDNDSSTTASSPSSPSFQFHSSYEDQKARTSSLPWPNHPPLYLGPMALTKCKEGGGRGYIATQDLPPGTCVLIEKPIVKGWSEAQMGKKLGLESIQYIFERDDAKLAIQCMEELHPRREKVLEIYKEAVDAATSDVDSLDGTQIIDMISNMNSDTSHVQQVKSLVEYANDHNITNSDGSHIEDIDINRLLLTLRYNGFDSGLYLHFSMVNHNEDPNLIKFRPSTNQHEDGLYYSEARTTRHVRKGEVLTLHYLENPREVSHATRRCILWDQHRFDIGDESAYKQFLDNGLYSDNERGNHIYESELILGKFPQSTKDGAADNGEGNDERDNVATTDNIEKSLDDLEDMLVEIQALTQSQSNEKNADDTTFDRAAALELTIGELIFASTSTLGNANHILLSRCWRLHIDIIEVILTNYTSKLTEKQSVDLMARFLLSVKPLLESQRCRLGIDHPDVARTYQDYSMALQVLLSHPKKLLSLNLGSLDQCSKMEHHSRKEKERIDAMYPKDVDIILDSVKKK